MKTKWAHVLRDIGLVWSLTFFAEVIITILYRGHVSQDVDAFRSVVTAKKVAIVFGFIIAGSLGREAVKGRLDRLFAVLIGIWLMNLLTIRLTPEFTLYTWFISIWPLSVFAISGAGLSLLFVAPVDHQKGKCEGNEMHKPLPGIVYVAEVQVQNDDNDTKTQKELESGKKGV